tara:strand:- start:3223 stop:4929 length:1707 start_codon:yes stop_codon:yes gene_type:complete
VFNILKSAYSILENKFKTKLNILYFIFFVSMIFESLSVGMFIPILNNFSGVDSNFTQYIPDFILPDSQKNNIIYLFLLLGLIFTVKTIFLTYSSYEKEKFAFQLSNFLSKKLHYIYLKKNFNFHIKNNSSVLIRDINDVKFGIDFYKGITHLVSEILILIGIIALVMIYNPISTIIISSSIGLMGFIFYKTIQSKAKKWGEIRQKFEEKRFFYLQLGFNEIKNIKLSNKEKHFNEIFSVSHSHNVKANFKNFFVMSLPKYWLEWLTLLVIISFIFFLIKLGLELNTILPQIGIYAIAAYRIVPAITRIMNAIQAMRYGSPAILKLKENLDQKEISSQQISDTNIGFEKKLVLKNINFSFNSDQTKIFENLDLELVPGSFNGIIGKSGVGKSTLINILSGLIKPTSGEILADNLNIFKNLKSWQSKIGYVPQNVSLSDLTIRENIAFGEDIGSINDKRVKETISLTQLNNFISNLREGIDTKIGEFGAQISGGQRQRIGIARALYKIPQILILDESTNSLDEKTEKEILNDILKLKKNNITLINISHNSNSLSICDNIFEIKNKNIFKL